MPDDLSPLQCSNFEVALNEFDDLVVQGDKAFLLGAGCSKCAGLPLATELMGMTCESNQLDKPTKTILTTIENRFHGSTAANIEDYLSELMDFVANAERRKARGANKATVSLNEIEYSVQQLRDAVDQVKEAIAEAIDVERVNLQHHRQFIDAVHRPPRSGRKAGDRCVDYLVLNYDTLIESALALERLRYADGMRGGQNAWWDCSAFESNQLDARVLKLHGSIDWSEAPGESLPRRIATNVSLDNGNKGRILIWPASTKCRESQQDPFAQLSQLARSILVPRPGRQTVLTVCGYGFGDRHINGEIERALRASRGELTVAVFTYDERPTGELKRLHEIDDIGDQIRIHARRGFFHGDTAVVSEVDLPWWKFETVARLLGGER
ncbi:MAG: SIR2 family protein [Rhodobacteraceae bacterium]|nr:SIR2 family protein [Paracoccaceae bacterium]